MNLQSILNQLSSNYKLKVVNDKAWICCPFHTRNGQLEKTPSFIINLSSNEGHKQGSGHCFGCGKNASWKEISKALGITGNVDFDPVESVVSAKQKEVDSAIIDWNPSKKWRGISGKLLTKLKCKSITKDGKDWIYIPCFQNKEKVGYIRGLVNRPSKKVLGYINSSGKWVSKTLFCFDYAKQFDTDWVVVVEGPRDCLNLLQYKIPAVAILGCSNLTKMKVELLLSSWSKIICGFDPDDAGDLATQKLKDLVGKRAELKKLYFEEGTDPADITKEEAEEIAKLGESKWT